MNLDPGESGPYSYHILAGLRKIFMYHAMFLVCLVQEFKNQAILQRLS